MYAMTRKNSAFYFALFLLFVLWQTTKPFANDVAVHADIRVRNQIYKKTPQANLALRIFDQPPAAGANKARPAILFFFGGGWNSGTMAQFEPQCRYFASRGMVAVSVDYRVASRHKTKAVDCVEDAKSAVRWIRQHAKELQINPHQICAAGGSAGGHLACCTAMIDQFDADDEDSQISSQPNAAALFNPAVILAELPDFSSSVNPQRLKNLRRRTGVDPKQISPIHHIKANLPPMIIFHGKADTTVPFDTVEEFSRRMQAQDNRCQLQSFEDAPHGFFNFPKEKASAERKDKANQWYRRTVWQLDRFLNSLGWLNGPPTMRIADGDYVSLRGNLANSLHQFTTIGNGHVAFLGGSITEANGYRTHVKDWLTQRFPETKFKFTNAGLSSTCSHAGAFRLPHDVLSKGKVDLLFVEFAVNDDQDANHDGPNCVRGMEGIIRAIRRDNPNTDIVMTHFINDDMLKTLAKGKRILSADQHEVVARHYQVSSSYLSKEVARRIRDNTMTWKQYGGTHPSPAGHRLAADQVISLLQAGWAHQDGSQLGLPHSLPTALRKDSFGYGSLNSPKSAANQTWSFSEPNWSALPGQTRPYFQNLPTLHCSTPDATTEYRFSGDAIGAFLLAGPDAGQLQVKVDEGSWKTVELYHRYSGGLHYPRLMIFADHLSPGPHVLKLKVAETHHERSSGHAVRLLSFAVNQVP